MFYYDFISATNYSNNDKLCFKYLNLIKEEKYIDYSKFHYSLTHERTLMKICWIPESNKLTFECSLPYFLLGHNYSITLKQEKDVIEYISNVLNIDMFKAEIDILEFGSVTEIPFSFNKIKNSHIKIAGMKTANYDYGKVFADRNVHHKIYDFQKNLKTKVDKEIREILKKDFDYSEDKVYVKIENRYVRPQVALKKRVILIEDIFEDELIKVFKTDLLTKYSSIKKNRAIRIQCKKQLSSTSICLIILKKLEDELGINTENLIKDTIKIYGDILTKEDQKARIKQLRNNLKKIELTKSEYDISHLLALSVQ
jgi:hypothetical protein